MSGSTMRARERNPEILTEEQLQERLPVLWQALDEFNQGLFFQSHETLEDLWLVTPLPAREMFRGIIQAAAALVHLARDEYPGTVGLLDAALGRLRPFAPSLLGVDVGSLIADLERFRDELATGGERGLAAVDRSRLPRVRYTRVASEG